jgi:hypothetical protein
VRPSAAGAVVHFVFAILDAIAAMLRIVRESLVLDFENEARHGRNPFEW